ncbi:MAG: hypothetical protein IJY47_04890 [Clostridia bacterium]|nr:hypothetical protein [Clostridia bacterium]
MKRKKRKRVHKKKDKGSGEDEKIFFKDYGENRILDKNFDFLCGMVERAKEFVIYSCCSMAD